MKCGSSNNAVNMCHFYITFSVHRYRQSLTVEEITIVYLNAGSIMVIIDWQSNYDVNYIRQEKRSKYCHTSNDSDK